MAEHTTDAIDARDLERLRIALLRLARRIRTQTSAPISQSQLSVLATVDRHGPMTIGEIADAERVRPPSASKVVAALDEAGLVDRQAAAGDRRCSVIGVSAAGRGLLSDIRAAGRGWLATRLDSLEPSDRSTVIEALPALEALLSAP